MTATDTADIVPAIDTKAEGHATASLATGDLSLASAALMRALERHAADIAGETEVSLVSVSFDMTGEAFSGGEIEIKSSVDRQTRSLLFMHAYAAHGSTTLIKATAIFRLS
ncbi:MAG: hypothetical protein RLN72_01250 [Henriciella sp.]